MIDNSFGIIDLLSELRTLFLPILAIMRQTTMKKMRQKSVMGRTWTRKRSDTRLYPDGVLVAENTK